MKIHRKSGPRRVLALETDYVVEDRGYTTSCWIWQGDKEGSGYGRIYQNGKRQKAHRFMYELLVGPIPKGLHLHHECEQRLCVNVEHLTPKEPGAHFNDHRTSEWYTKRPPRGVPAYVGEIRRLYATGDYSFKELGEKFGVSSATTHRIVRGLRYQKSSPL